MDLDTAKAQCKALRDAARQSPVMNVRYDLLARSREWQRAAQGLIDLIGEATVNEATGERIEPEPTDTQASIELVGSLGVGTLVMSPSEDADFAPVIRVIASNGQTSLHLEDARDPRGKYLNFIGPTSPIVVKEQTL